MIHPVGGRPVADVVKQERTERSVPDKSGTEPADRNGVLVEIGQDRSPAEPVTYDRPAGWIRGL